MIRTQRRFLNTLGVALILIICAVVALLLQRSRERAIDDLQRDTRNLTAALSLYTRGIVASIDLALVGGRDSLARLQLSERGPVPPELGNEVMRENVARIGLPVLMRRLSAEGYQVFSSDAQPYTASSKNQEFFRVHVAGDAGLFISQPFVSRINGKWAIVFSRRISGPNGQFDGVMLIGTPIELFERVFERFEIGARGTLILADDNGTLIARRPADFALVGKKILHDDGALNALRSGVNAGVRISKASPDGVERMRGFERVSGTRLVVGVGQSVDDWLANWRREALIFGSVTLLFGGLALVMLFRTTRQAEDAAARAEQLRLSEERTLGILSHAPDAFIAMDHHGRITDWNDQAQATLGWERAEVLGRAVAEVVIPPRMRDAHAAGLRSFVHSGAGPVVNRRIEVMALHRAGHEIPIELSIGALRAGEVFTAIAFLHDITERKHVQARLAAGEQRLRAITDNLPVLISYIDREERLRFCNETFREWMGIDPAEAIGRPIAEVLGPELYSQRREHLRRSLGGERVEFEFESSARGIERSLQTAYIPDLQADGSVAGIYALSTDVTALRQAERRMSDLARVDSLTGVPNRRRFDERLPEAIARSRRENRPMALMILDVDHFKEINDVHGHAGGDAVLKEIARRLLDCVRTTDMVARLAGDEFVIILEGLRNHTEAELVARKIGVGLKPAFSLGTRSIGVSCSIGVAFVDRDAVSGTDLIAKADAALYDAKRAGRDTFAIATM